MGDNKGKAVPPISVPNIRLRHYCLVELIEYGAASKTVIPAGRKGGREGGREMLKRVYAIGSIKDY